MDIQQWVIGILKGNKRKDDIQCQIENLFKYLIHSNCQIRKSVKQCFFNQLCNLIIELKQEKFTNTLNMTEILNILTGIIVKCLPEHVKEIKDYNLPYHPCLTKEEEEQQQDDTSTVIIDLYFFYVKNILNDKTITCAMIHQIHESKVNVSPSSTKRYEIL
ncbi:unnamed protein product, partial [Didymodactylos carnosus]